jgi:hypothetical protein
LWDASDLFSFSVSTKHWLPAAIRILLQRCLRHRPIQILPIKQEGNQRDFLSEKNRNVKNLIKLAGLPEPKFGKGWFHSRFFC